MNERRFYRGRDKVKYIQMHVIIRRRVKELIKSLLANKCTEIDEVEEKHDS